MNAKTIVLSIASGLLCIFFAAGARADDSEIFFSQNNSNVAPNVLLILDTSGSMDSEVSSEPDYDASITYTGACSPSYYYYTASGKPKCTAANRVPVANFFCASGASQLGSVAGATGQYASSYIRWGKVTSAFQWTNNLGVGSGTDVECLADAGIDGNGNPALRYPTKFTDPAMTSGIWDTGVNSWWGVFGNAGTPTTFYSANYINYINDASLITTQSKIKIMQDAVKTLLTSVTNVNVGLMRYDLNGNGGMVVDAMGPIASNATAVTNSVNSWAAAGSTPLTKTLFESYRYLSGGPVTFGNTSRSTQCLSTFTNANGAVHCTAFSQFLFPSVAASRSGSNYDSPADLSCQKNYVIFLTDGQSNNNDTAIDNTIRSLPSFGALGGVCDSTTPPGAFGGLCLGALSQYMNRTDLRSDVGSVQNVTTYYIGFGDTFKTDPNATAYFNYLQNAASRGGGQAFTATSLSELTAVFSQIFNEVQKINTTFSSPAVAVNAFNRTQTLNDLYISVFTPRSTFHWPGNVKKYKLVNGQVVDVNNAAAVDPATGFLSVTAQSFWGGVVDGPDVTKGGAASQLPIPSARTVYTYLGSNPAPGSSAPVVLFDTAPDAAFNISGLPPDPTRVDLINWAKGYDVLDENNDGSTSDTRHVMGDPIHTQPGVVIYGTGASDIVLYTPTNDGYLHATSAADGSELWSFIPQELLAKLKLLYADNPTTVKNYGLDGQVTILKYDVNGNGVIDPPNDRVLLFFGTGRNAQNSGYYALDVTDKTTPRFLWAITGAQLPNLGQAWSTPTLARLDISGATQNSQKLVAVIGGGYDPAEDGYTYVPNDTVGNHIYFVDALYGTLLWSVGSSGSTLNIARMTHSIPSPVTVLDLSGDGVADRMYVGDMGGQVWRFDINSGQNAANLVAGGVIASLGSKDEFPHLAANTRRFYSQPDVSAVARPGQSVYLNVAIASGYRGHPLDNSVVDRLYGVRDYNAFLPMTQAAYNTLMSPMNLKLDSSFQDVTTDALQAIPLPPSSPGWKVLLTAHGSGEKSITAATTFNGTVFFTTYQPTVQSTTDPCEGVGSGINRLYSVNVIDGSAAFDTNKDGTYTVSERSSDLSQGGIAPSATVVLNAVPTDPNTGQPIAGSASPPTILVGVETSSPGPVVGLRKTYWHDMSAQ